MKKVSAMLILGIYCFFMEAVFPFEYDRSSEFVDYIFEGQDAEQAGNFVKSTLFYKRANAIADLKKAIELTKMHIKNYDKDYQDFKEKHPEWPCLCLDNEGGVR